MDNNDLSALRDAIKQAPGKYYQLEQLTSIRCGNNPITLRPVDFGLVTDDTITETMPLMFNMSPEVKKFLPTLDFSTAEKIKKFAMLTSERTEAGLQFTYGIYFNNLLVGMIFVNTPIMNKMGMGFDEWTLDFFIFKPLEGQRVMSVALMHMMLFLQKTIGVDTFYLLVDHDNERCINLIEQLPIDRVASDGFHNLEKQGTPPLVFVCPLSRIRFQ